MQASYHTLPFLPSPEEAVTAGGEREPRGRGGRWAGRCFAAGLAASAYLVLSGCSADTGSCGYSQIHVSGTVTAPATPTHVRLRYRVCWNGDCREQGQGLDVPFWFQIGTPSAPTPSVRGWMIGTFASTPASRQVAVSATMAAFNVREGDDLVVEIEDDWSRERIGGTDTRVVFARHSCEEDEPCFCSADMTF